MHYLFLDETYRPVNAPETIVIGAWMVDQNVMNHGLEIVSLLQEPGRESRLDRIVKSLDRLDARAGITWSNLGSERFHSGQRYRTSDVSDMSVSKIAWSVAVIFAIESLLVDHKGSKLELGTVDVHYDPQSLKADHQSAVERTLHDFLESGLRDADRRFGRGALKRVRIRRIEPVAKAALGERRSKFQLGTWLADQICSRSDRIRAEGGTSRVSVRDLTNAVDDGVRSLCGRPV